MMVELLVFNAAASISFQVLNYFSLINGVLIEPTLPAAFKIKQVPEHICGFC